MGSAKIHTQNLCKCNRVCNFLSSNKKDGHVIELINNSGRSKYIVVKKLENHDITKNILDRDGVTKYFSRYLWDANMCHHVRNTIQTIPSINYCVSDIKKNNIFTSNGGIILLGTYLQIQELSSLYNNNVSNKEFTSLHSLPARTLHKEDKVRQLLKIMSRSIKNIKMPNGSDPHILLGQNNPNFHGDDNLDIAFGKREWSCNLVESSMTCALRELFEEFNIQFSQNILQYNMQLDKKKYVSTDSSAIAYIIYLPEYIYAKYYPECDTIYIDIHNRLLYR